MKRLLCIMLVAASLVGCKSDEPDLSGGDKNIVTPDTAQANPNAPKPDSASDRGGGSSIK